MRIGSVGRQAPEGGRRRGFGGMRWWILLLFAGYAAWSWFGNAKVDPYTGEKARYGATAEEEVQLGAQAFDQVLGDAQAQGALMPADAQVSQQVREIAQRLVERVPEVTAELAALHQQPAQRGRQPKLPGETIDRGAVGSLREDPAAGRRGDEHDRRIAEPSDAGQPGCDLRGAL